MKRSSQVALLLMGTVSVGGVAYAMMPSERCEPNQPAVALPGQPQPQQQPRNCSHRSWHWGSSSSSDSHHSSSSSSSSRSSSGMGFYGGNSGSSSSSVSHSTSAIPSGVSRGGFGSFASHFSGGG
jgi:hypothetical protein